MTPFAAPVAEILYSLEHLGRAGDLPGHDPGTYRQIAEHFGAFAEGTLAPLNATGDREGARLENGRVRMPDGFQAAYRAFCDQGWPGLTLPEDVGGQGMGPLAQGIVTEIFAGANHAFEMITGLVPGAARTLLAFGTPDQCARALPKLASGEWLSTMALTEPGAGSDLSRIKCRADREGAGWQITGEKIFISGGDQDLSDGILHLVLARTSGEGVDGLSLFYCPSERANGTRNGVAAVRLEDKLGIHASPTCQLQFDRAEAELMGDEGGGLRAMFTVMNHARLSVALEGVAHAARARAIAEAHAGIRVQGRDAPIATHADVARMLGEIQIREIGARGIVHLALVAMESGAQRDLVELLTPVAKVFATDAGFEAADIGIQVLGGYGYLEDYGMAQVLRDARITRIYEGTNGIHALTLVTRLLRQAAPLEAFDALVCDTPGLSEPHAQWREAWADVARAADPRPLAHGFMGLTAELAHQFVWARAADSADAHPDPPRLHALVRRARTRFAVRFAQYTAEKAADLAG